MSLRNFDIVKRLSLKTFRKSIIKFTSCRAVSSLQKANAEVEYPPIKPKYPPGEWGSMATWKTWEMVKRAEEFDKISDVKQRLEAMAGDEDRPITEMTPSCSCPGELQYKQFMTKTHIAQNPFEDLFNDATDAALLDSLIPVVEQIIHQEIRKCREQQSAPGAKIWTRLVDVLAAATSVNCEHLRYASYDHEVPFSAFFTRRLAVDDEFDFDEQTMLQRKRDRLYNDKIDEDDKVEYMWTEMRTTQIKQTALYQIRSHQPLEKVLIHGRISCPNISFILIYWSFIV